MRLSKVFGKHLKENEAPVNAVGGGNIAGVGIGPDGEPGGKKKKKSTINIVIATIRRNYGGSRTRK